MRKLMIIVSLLSFQAFSQCDVARVSNIRSPDNGNATLIVQTGTSEVEIPLGALIKAENLDAGGFVLLKDAIPKSCCAVLNYTWGPEEDESEDFCVRVISSSDEKKAILEIMDSDGKMSVVSKVIEISIRQKPSNAQPKKVKFSVTGSTLNVSGAQQFKFDLSKVLNRGGKWTYLPEAYADDFPHVIQWSCTVDTLNKNYCGCNSSKRSKAMDIFRDNPTCSNLWTREISFGFSINASENTIIISPLRSNLDRTDLAELGIELERNSTFKIAGK